MFKSALLISTLVLFSACKDHHGHGPTPAWIGDVTVGEEGLTRQMPVLMDDYESAISYSAVSFHAEAPVLKGHTLHRAFSLNGEGEQRVRTEVKCDTSKSGTPGVAGEASLSLLGTTVRFYCQF